MSSNKVQQGFTLLEVLVASVILITSIAAISLAYRGALISSERADKNIQISGVIPIIVSAIAEDLRARDNGQVLLSGEGTAWGANYSWKAELSEFKPPPEQFDIDVGHVVSYKPRFRLWAIELIVNFNGVKRPFFYSEVSWLNATQ
ncbi:type II secretion system protein [uncultured Paraglaciecola sp.]|uniref:type II secretion system protein n=1 Tax=uncultured Paraglaciecola sp. TaxID=1765024 RepID=UPI0025D43426|nr:type II secretion system protein [uncultured Paraglaciecola sp.]